jgi:hypothetical protein
MFPRQPSQCSRQWKPPEAINNTPRYSPASIVSVFMMVTCTDLGPENCSCYNDSLGPKLRRHKTAPDMTFSIVTTPNMQRKEEFYRSVMIPPVILISAVFVSIREYTAWSLFIAALR